MKVFEVANMVFEQDTLNQLIKDYYEEGDLFLPKDTLANKNLACSFSKDELPTKVYNSLALLYELRNDKKLLSKAKLEFEYYDLISIQKYLSSMVASELEELINISLSWPEKFDKIRNGKPNKTSALL